MNRWIIAAGFAGLLPGAFASTAIAAEGANDALLACANEADDASRLRCFDAVVADLRRAPAAPVAAVAARPAASAPAAAAPAATPEERFGARGELKPEHHTELSEIAGTVAALGTKPHGELIVTLDNGQVWAEIATGSKIKLKTGDAVKIERGSLGSFFLISPNGRSSKVARVR